MPVYTVSIFQGSGGSVNVGDGTLLANLSVSAGRGPKGDGFTGGVYNASTGKITFTSNDGLGFETGDLRTENFSEPSPIGDVTPNTGAFTSLSATGNITVTGTVDGRDVAADGSKLDGIEALADVTDTANVTAAGALMDSELTNIAAVKALNQGVATTDSPTFAEITASQYNSTEALPDIKPSLNLDFANTKKLDPRITFTRGSTAAYYDGVTFAKAEENLLRYSQEFNTGWSNTGSSDTANTETAPDGTTTADTITASAGSSDHFIVQSATTISGQDYVVSIYAKAGTNNYIQIAFGSQTAAFANFDITSGAGVTGTSANVTSTAIQDVGNGWYRCSVVVESTVPFTSLIIALADSASMGRLADWAAAGTETVFLWGAQLEQRSALTDYTPTTTQPITNYIPALQTAASGEARFDHDPITGESKGLLIEEARTNLVTYSEQFDNAAWGKTSTTVTSNIVVAPDGTLTGDKLIADAVNPSIISRSISVPASSTDDYYPTCYVKAGSATGVVLNVYYIGNTEDNVTFNMVNGAIIGVPNAGEAINEDVGNGWRRIGFRITRDATGTRTAIAFRMWVGGVRGAAVVGAYHYVWGAQLEEGAFPTSYIPTVASQVTRSADAASMTGTNFSSWYRQDEGTVFVEGRTPDTLAGFLTLDNGTNLNRTRVFQITASSIRTQIEYNGVSQAIISAGIANINVYNKLALSYATNDIAVYREILQTNSSASIPTVNQLRIGEIAGAPLNGHIKKLAFYPKRLSNQTLQALTEE